MLYYLDTMVVIYAVEGEPALQQRAQRHLAALEAGGHEFAISDLTRTECMVPVFGPGAGQRLSDFYRFFHGPNLRTLNLSSSAYARASAIRGAHNYQVAPPAPARKYGLADALHLATAMESGCDVFLTNDNQLSNFSYLTIEELP